MRFLSASAGGVHHGPLRWLLNIERGPRSVRLINGSFWRRGVPHFVRIGKMIREPGGEYGIGEKERATHREPGCRRTGFRAGGRALLSSMDPDKTEAPAAPHSRDSSSGE